MVRVAEFLGSPHAGQHEPGDEEDDDVHARLARQRAGRCVPVEGAFDAAAYFGKGGQQADYETADGGGDDGGSGGAVASSLPGLAGSVAWS